MKHSRDGIGARKVAPDAFVGESPGAVAVRRALSTAGSSESTVLIVGPTGTGKELAARVVHAVSERCGEAFIAVDCGAFPESLIESELFGHARGAFTGAVSDRAGLFEAASGGTLFLDEVSNTTLSFQARLLRSLEEGEIRRIGETEARAVDVRVVAATNRSLNDLVKRGEFREDLYYRLDVLRVELPTLAARRPDIAVIAEHLLLDIGEQTGACHYLSEEAISVLVSHSWPGNVRELRNVLESAIAQASQPCIRRSDLPERLRGRQHQAAGHLSLEERLAEFERQIILERLEANAWSRAATARDLGIARQTLYEKINRLGLRDRVASRWGIHATDDV